MTTINIVAIAVTITYWATTGVIVHILDAQEQRLEVIGLMAVMATALWIMTLVIMAIGHAHDRDLSVGFVVTGFVAIAVNAAVAYVVLRRLHVRGV